MEQEILFSEGKNNVILSLLILAATTLLTVGCFYFGKNNNAFVAAGVTIATIGYMGTVLFFSTGLYNKIILTKDSLTVGKAVIPIGDIDARLGARHANEVLSPPDMDKFNSISQKADNTILLGGSYGPTMGSTLLLFKLKNGQQYTVSTFKPERFLAALNQLLGYNYVPASVAKRRKWPVVVTSLLFLILLVLFSKLPGVQVLLTIMFILWVVSLIIRGRKLKNLTETSPSKKNASPK